MPTKEQTKLEVFGFSDKPEDKFYCLMDLTHKTAEIDLKKLSSTAPEKLDEALQEMGCLALLSRTDIETKLNGSDEDQEDLHEKMYNWAHDQGIV
ncbi:MAG: hypothetical protein WD491_07175 [Balneolales bacterium]